MEFKFDLANVHPHDLQNSTDVEPLTLARAYTSLAVLFVSCLFLLAALYNLVHKNVRYHRSYYCCCKTFVDYFTSPFFLLALISILPVAAYSIVLHTLVKKNSKKNHYLDSDFCRNVPGWFLLWFDSAETLGLTFFSVYFLIYYIPFYNKKTPATEAVATERTPLINEHAKRNKDAKPNEHAEREMMPKVSWRYWLHSICSVVCFILVIAICGVYTMPYVVQHTSKGEYDKVGPWCWIKPKSAQIRFWFIEECAYMLISFIALTSSLILLCCVTREEQKRFPKGCFQEIWWDKLIFVPFLIFYFYFLLQFVFIAIDIILRMTTYDFKWLWYVYSIGKPISKVLVVISALQLMSTSYRVVKKRPPLIESTSVHVEEGE